MTAELVGPPQEVQRENAPFIVTTPNDSYGHIHHTNYNALYLPERRAAAQTLWEVAGGKPLAPSRLTFTYLAQLRSGNEVTVATYGYADKGIMTFSQEIRRFGETVNKAESIYATTGDAHPSAIPPDARVETVDFVADDEFTNGWDAVSPMGHALYFERDRIRFMQKRDLGLQKLQQQEGVDVVVRELDVRYHNPLRVDMPAQIQSWVDVTKSRLIFNQHMVDENGKPVSSSSSTYVVIDSSSYRPQRISQSLTEKLQHPGTIEVPYSKDLVWS